MPKAIPRKNIDSVLSLFSSKQSSDDNQLIEKMSSEITLLQRLLGPSDFIKLATSFRQAGDAPKGKGIKDIDKAVETYEKSTPFSDNAEAMNSYYRRLLTDKINPNLFKVTQDADAKVVAARENPLTIFFVLL